MEKFYFLNCPECIINLMESLFLSHFPPLDERGKASNIQRYKVTLWFLSLGELPVSFLCSGISAKASKALGNRTRCCLRTLSSHVLSGWEPQNRKRVQLRMTSLSFTCLSKMEQGKWYLRWFWKPRSTKVCPCTFIVIITIAHISMLEGI